MWAVEIHLHGTFIKFMALDGDLFTVENEFCDPTNPGTCCATNVARLSAVNTINLPIFLIIV